MTAVSSFVHRNMATRRDLVKTVHTNKKTVGKQSSEYIFTWLLLLIIIVCDKVWINSGDRINALRTGYYLSPGGAGGWRILGRITFRRTKGGISRNWEPKRGDQWKRWKDSDGGPLKLAWTMKTWWGGGEGRGSRKLSMVIRGITSVS